MTESSVLVELISDVVPTWCGKLERYIKESEEAQKLTSGIVITPSSGEENDSTAKVLTPGIEGLPAAPENPSGKDKQPIHLRKSFASPHGLCRLDSKPDSTPRTRFSSLTGPVIMYDGESQRMLADLWTLLNNKRGGLRREMMNVKRRQELAAPRMMASIEVDSDTEASTGKDEDEDIERSSEMLRLRLKMEREKMKRMNRRAGGGISGGPVGVTRIGSLPFKRARTMAAAPSSTIEGGENAPWGADDAKMKSLLETIDDDLDKACKVTETVAFLWLKGDAYEAHLKFIVGRLKDAAAKIEKSGLLSPKETEGEASTLASSSATATNAKSMPPPATATSAATATPARPGLIRKNSDSTMRDACPVSLVMNSEEQSQQITTEIPSTKDNPNPESSIASMAGPSRAGPSSTGQNKPPEPITTPLGAPVIEVDDDDDDDDDEGIVC